MGVDPVAIASRGHVLNPVLIFQVPGNGFFDTTCKSLFRCPTQGMPYFAGIDGIAAIMTWPVFDKGDEFLIAF